MSRGGHCQSPCRAGPVGSWLCALRPTWSVRSSRGGITNDMERLSMLACQRRNRYPQDWVPPRESCAVAGMISHFGRPCSLALSFVLVWVHSYLPNPFHGVPRVQVMRLTHGTQGSRNRPDASAGPSNPRNRRPRGRNLAHEWQTRCREDVCGPGAFWNRAVPHHHACALPRRQVHPQTVQIELASDIGVRHGVSTRSAGRSTADVLTPLRGFSGHPQRNRR